MDDLFSNFLNKNYTSYDEIFGSGFDEVFLDEVNTVRGDGPWSLIEYRGAPIAENTVDPILGTKEGVVRFYAALKNAVGKVVQFTVKYRPAFREWGVIKPSSGNR
jgi:hypothetical protein